MWTTQHTDRILRTFVSEPRRTAIIASLTPGGPRFADADALLVAEAVRERARELRVPIVVRTRPGAQTSASAIVIVYHVPDVIGSRMPC